MTYPNIGSHRIAFDIDGSAVGYRFREWNTSADILFAQGLASWITSTDLGKLNGETRQKNWGDWSNGSPSFAFWFFFPEAREITHMGCLFGDAMTPSLTEFKLQGSNDSTNGMDGTWEDAIINFATSRNADYWRTPMAVSFSGPKKFLRVAFTKGTGTNVIDVTLWALHFYGSKASGQTPDDIAFCDSSNVILTALKDYGDTPEGTTEITSFKVKNISSTKTANGVNIQLNHTDYGISFSESGPWVSYLDISTISPESVSAPIYVKRSLGPPLLVLGPRSARAIVTVASWT